MDTFLGPAAFAGASIDVAAARPIFVGEATFDGHLAFASWDRAELAALLPPELSLARPRARRKRHPLVFIFGEQRAGGIMFGGRPVPMHVRYGEFALAIPFVHHRGGRHLHSFMARMYAGYFPATWNGNAHYGLAKEMAEIAWHPPMFSVAAPGGGLLFHGSVEATGDWVPGPDPQLSNFRAARAAFALPIIGRKANGTYACSYFGWDFAEATVRPTRCALSIDAALIPRLAPRHCHAVHEGAFEVRGMRWRLSWPWPCHDR